MSRRRRLLIGILAAGATLSGFAIHSRLVMVRAARLGSIGPPMQYFPQGSIWTQDISQAAVDPHSDVAIAWLTGAGGWGRGRMQTDFSMRVMQATSATPKVPFRRGGNWMAVDSDSTPTIPLPANGGMEGRDGYQCDVDEEDCHLIVVDPLEGKLYEAYQATYADNSVSASLLAVWNLSRIYPPSGRGNQCTSADAAGLPIAPLLFNADDLARGSINHAVRFTLPNTRIRAGVFVSPATHAGAPRGPDIAPPMGARFRLKASYNLSQLSPAAQVVARAMQKYGMFLADGGNVVLTAQNDADTRVKYSDLGFGSHSLERMKVTDFEIVNEGQPIRLTDDCVRNR